MGTQFVAAVRTLVYDAALFRFYFSKNLVAYVTARMCVSHRGARLRATFPRRRS